MQRDGFDAADLVAIFAAAFAQEFRTRLVAGGEEPLYRPSVEVDGWHEIIFRRDWFQSAMHEIAHWCVAGAGRRRLVDYGYWYDPDGRTRARQSEFERVEVRPQAVEWVLTRACGKVFDVSIDNLDCAEPLDADAFRQAVHAEVLRSIREGALPPRAERLGCLLAAHYGQPWPLEAGHFGEPAAPAPAPVAGLAAGGEKSSV